MLKVQLASARLGSETVVGVLISGRSKGDVDAVVDLVQRYYDIPGLKAQSFFEFRRARRDKHFTFLIDYGSDAGYIEIGSVNAEIPQALINGLRRFGSFFVMLEHGESDKTLIDEREFKLLRSELSVNGVVYRGNNVQNVNWSAALHVDLG